MKENNAVVEIITKENHNQPPRLDFINGGNSISDIFTNKANMGAIEALRAYLTGKNDVAADKPCQNYTIAFQDYVEIPKEILREKRWILPIGAMDFYRFVQNNNISSVNAW